MKFRIRHAQQVVGAFVLLALLLLVSTLIFMGINQRWFAKNYHFTSRFQSADGLTVGMSIKLRGFEIGKLSRITLTEENRVAVDLEIYDTFYPKVLPNSVLELAMSPIGLGGGLVFLPSRGAGQPMEEHGYIPSTDTPEGKELVDLGLVDRLPGNEQIAGIISQVEPLLFEVRGTVSGINQLLETLNKTLDGSIGTPAPGLVGDIQTLMAGVNATVANLNKTIVMTSGHADTILGNAGSISGDLARVTAQMEDVKGLIPKLLDPKGSMATLLDDNNALFNQIQGILKQLDGTIREVNTFTRFINRQSPQITGLLEETKQAVKQSQDVLEGLSNNPLLRGGITEKKSQGETFQAFREEDLR